MKAQLEAQGRWERTETDVNELHQLHIRNLTYRIVIINLADAPRMTLLSDPLSGIFLASIIQIPTIERSLGGRRLIRKSVELVDPADPACPLSYGVIDIACFGLTVEVEADKVEIPAS